MTKRKIGFATLTPEQLRERASLGGQAVSQDRSHMAEIGRKGGLKTASNKAHMSEIGRKGGKNRHKSKTPG